MNEEDEIQPRPEGMQFPCVIDVKVFLKFGENNLELVRDVLLSNLPNEDVISISTRESSKGKYQSYSCKINAQDKQQMDELFVKLSDHPEVVMVI